MALESDAGLVSQHADPVMAFVLQFVGSTQIDRPGFVFGFLRRRGVPEATVEEVNLRSVPQLPGMALFRHLVSSGTWTGSRLCS